MFTEGFGDYACIGDTITCTVDGFDITARLYEDDDKSPPWERDDGHGPVSGWTSDDMGKGHRILLARNGQGRYYDFNEAKRIALRDGWGGKSIKGNPHQRAAKAAEDDFEALYAWCRDDWTYVGVAVTVSHSDVQLTGKYDFALWGVDMNYPGSDNSYLMEVANDQLPQALEAAREKITELAASLQATTPSP